MCRVLGAVVTVLHWSCYNLYWCIVVFAVFSQIVQLAYGYGDKTGCMMETPYNLYANPDPVGTPLLLELDIYIIGLREVSDSGGSFGVDVEYVNTLIVLSVCYSNLNPFKCFQDFCELGR